MSCVQIMLRAANPQTWWTINKHTAGHSIGLTSCVSGAEGGNALIDRILDIKPLHYMNNYFFNLFSKTPTLQGQTLSCRKILL